MAYIEQVPDPERRRKLVDVISVTSTLSGILMIFLGLGIAGLGSETIGFILSFSGWGIWFIGGVTVQILK